MRAGPNRHTPSEFNQCTVFDLRPHLFPHVLERVEDVASHLGYAWTYPGASGQYARVWRCQWELSSDPILKDRLIAYNMDDCRAAATVADALVRICGGSDSGLDAVDIASLEVGSHRTFGKFDSVLPEFATINDAAYWDYQRDRIYIRSSACLRRAAQTKRRDSRRSLLANMTISPSRLRECPTCSSNRVTLNGRHSRLLFDIRFPAGGLKRWVTKYVVDYYKCRNCGASFASDQLPLERHRYGGNVLAFVIYNLIELHIPQYKLAHIMQKIFGYPLVQPNINRMI